MFFANSYLIFLVATLSVLARAIIADDATSHFNTTFNESVGSATYANIRNASYSSGETKIFYFNVTQVDAAPDGYIRSVIGINNQWPCPNIHVNRGDRVVIVVHNQLANANTSLHVHGLFQHGTSQYDGPEMITQCPIPPGETMVYNFTIPDQAGAYWYHSHTKGQYGDGFRGAFIVHDDTDSEVWNYDEDVVLTVSEWYHQNSSTLDKSFLNRYNPTGAEPIPDNLLFNGSFTGSWHVKPNTTYLLRIINIGAFVSQYLYVDNHNFTVVEVDGVRVQPNVTDMIYITVAQRYTVLFTTGTDTDVNFAFMQAVDEEMLDVPGDFSHNVTNQLIYNSDASSAEAYNLTRDDWGDLDDFYLQPLEDEELYETADYQVTLDVAMKNLANGVNYAFFNNITYISPKVPTLFTAMGAGDLATNPTVYGSNTHSFVLQKDEIIEIVLNNQDKGKHPFHLHGHIFQTVIRGPDYSDEDEPISYEPSNFTSDVLDRPMLRDTLYVRPQSYFVIRFKADNPGVWFFHCHIEWHLSQGLAAVFIEDPLGIQENEQLSEDSKRMCEAFNINVKANAANNTDFLNLAGENVQVKPLPDGFTAKGIVAMVFSCIAGVLGVICITIYGMSDIKDVQKLVGEEFDVDLLHDEEDSGSSDSFGDVDKNNVFIDETAINASK